MTRQFPAVPGSLRPAVSGNVRHLPYVPGMAGTVRLEFRVSTDLKARVDARRVELGQTMQMFLERALESALHAGIATSSAASTRTPSEAQGVLRTTLPGPAPVPSTEGVRPAAFDRSHIKPQPKGS